MSVALGVSPVAVTGLGLPMFEAVQGALAERWTTSDELLAQLVEQTHELRRVVMAALGTKQGDLPRPLHIPRPTDEKPKPPTAAERIAWVRRHGGKVSAG